MEHWMTGGKLLLAVMLMAGCAAPAAVSAQPAATNGAVLRYEEPKFLTGTIYTKGSDRTNALFRFTRAATRSGNTLKVLREFTQPDGKPAARERVVYEGDDLVSYELEELQTGGRGSAQIREKPGQARKEILFQYAKEEAANDKPRTRSEPLKKDAHRRHGGAISQGSLGGAGPGQGREMPLYRCSAAGNGWLLLCEGVGFDLARAKRVHHQNGTGQPDHWRVG